MIKPLACVFLVIAAPVTLAQHQHGLPLLPAASSAQQGFVRIINHSERDGTVRIHAIDDEGERFGPVTLELLAKETKHFNSRDLEDGNVSIGLSGGVGDGTGDWRLELLTGLDIEPLAYVRTPDGFLTGIHDIVQGELDADEMRYPVRFFNPGSNLSKQSRLRLVNPTGAEVEVTIAGLDDKGEPAPGGEVRLTLPAHGAHTLTAQDLESGSGLLDDGHGALGDGRGKWQLLVTPDASGGPLQVMSLLLATEAGTLANLSATGAGNDPTRGGPGTDWLSGGKGDDVINPGDNDDEYDRVLGSPGNDRIVYTDSGASAYQALSYIHLGGDDGIKATIDGTTNRATVDKGAAGTDTIADVANPLNAGREAPYGGFGLAGSPDDDTFDLRLADGQFMEVQGHAGNDRVHIRSGRVKVNYRLAPGAVAVDLGAGRASDDGYGSADTFTGDVWEVEGGPHDDTLRGSDGSDRLNGGAGNDVLTPGDGDYSIGDGDDLIRGSAGNDRIVYTDSGGPRAWQYLDYDRLGQGLTATIDGVANRATVNKGAAGTDTIVDIATPLNGGNFGLEGTSHDDTFHLTVGDGQWMLVRGNAGNDTFNFRGGGGTARLDYRNAPAGVDVDLGAGRASDDGYGDVDTINGHVRDIRGSNFNDVIRGSDNDETFIGRGGDDVIDGGGGFDRLRFDRSGVGPLLFVDMGEGSATGTWDGRAFSYTFSNIEHVRVGRDGINIILDGPGDDTLEGGGDSVELFVISHGGNDTIRRFTSGEEDDFIWLDDDLVRDHGLTHSDVIAAAVQDGEDVLIDLSSYGEGTIRLRHFNLGDLQVRHFLL